MPGVGLACWDDPGQRQLGRRSGFLRLATLEPDQQGYQSGYKADRQDKNNSEQQDQRAPGNRTHRISARVKQQK